MKMFYEKDTDPNLIKNKKIKILRMASPIPRNVRRPCTKVFHHPNPPQVPYDEKIQKHVKNKYFYIFSLTPIPYGGCYIRSAKCTLSNPQRS